MSNELPPEISVLVVDDNPEILSVLTQILSGLRVKSICAVASAEEGLTALGSRQFSLILCDYRLEGMDGIQFIERLRSTGNEIPVILISGAPDKAGVIRATQFRQVDVLGKPFHLAELTDAMQRLLAA